MPKKKAMSSEKASQVKKDGHKNEDDFSILVGGKKITGTGKTDCILNDKHYSLKQICKRIQFGLYNINSEYWKKEEIIHKALDKKIINFDVSYLETGGCSVTIERKNIAPNLSYTLYYRSLCKYILKKVE